ncbi:MAG: hypothetical protein M3282_09805 [Gemmatimonadota bacterium]|nr:hypothetical protein [Gemmatimonadota bacterium]
MTTSTSSGRALPAFTPPTPSIRPAPRRRWVYPAWLAPLGVGAVVLAVAAATMSPWPVGVYYDDGVYLILGKALATGEGYRYLNLPGHPAATHYPPGYPALLALLWMVAPSFPENVAVFKLANAVLLSLAAAGLFIFARRELALGTSAAAGAILLGCLTVPMLAVTGVLFSEPLFLAVLALALPACERALREDRTRNVVVAALLAGTTTLVRSIGLSLVAALVLGLLLHRRYRAAAVAAAVAGALLLPWQLWTAVHADDLPRVVAGSYGSYTAAFGEALDANGAGYLARVASYNVRDLARPIGAVFAPGVGPAMRALAVLAVVGVLGVGASVLTRRAPVTALFLLGYAAIVVTWPYAPDRFLWGVWPLLLLTLALGAAAGVRGARERRANGLPLVAHAALVVAAGALVLGLVRYNARGYHKAWWDTSQRALARQLLPLVDWTERNTRPGDVIASDGDPLLHLYTGRHVVPSARWAVEAYPAAADSASRLADLRELLATYRVRYLLLSNSKSHSSGATAVLREGPHPSLQMLTILPGGGAVFTTAPDVNRE